ncbi:hypothetical protein PR048_026297 [Dryococelus australis]|uniref:Mediator of RNA polymerase II transcription subunit 20 n=1 Tax=Dryococelus australis TaxID=614101 RepID=A0ABQ9GKY3_9NEOP|nr:hypothetical protein PR048_026297 [Dryococelus australis]
MLVTRGAQITVLKGFYYFCAFIRFRANQLGCFTYSPQFLIWAEEYTTLIQVDLEQGFQKCSFYGVQRTVHVLHNSEQPASVFSILDTGTKTISLVADGLFDLLMMKMTSMYTSKKQTKIESKGPRFEIGDFCVKLGSVTMSQNFKGVLVEVRHSCFFLISNCVTLDKNFLRAFLKFLACSVILCRVAKQQPTEKLGKYRLIQQYLRHLNNKRGAPNHREKTMHFLHYNPFTVTSAFSEALLKFYFQDIPPPRAN